MQNTSQHYQKTKATNLQLEFNKNGDLILTENSKNCALN